MEKLDKLTPRELLALHAAVSDELRRRGVTRSSNNPVGDLAEYLFCRAFNWNQAPNSMRDADATDEAQLRYQIKGRRVTARNSSRQLGALRNLPERRFDFLAAVLFQESYRVQRAALVPHALVLELAKRVEHTNSWRFMLSDNVWLASGVVDVTSKLQLVENGWSKCDVHGSQVVSP